MRWMSRPRVLSLGRTGEAVSACRMAIALQPELADASDASSRNAYHKCAMCQGAHSNLTRHS